MASPAGAGLTGSSSCGLSHSIGLAAAVSRAVATRRRVAGCYGVLVGVSDSMGVAAGRRGGAGCVSMSMSACVKLTAGKISALREGV